MDHLIHDLADHDRRRQQLDAGAGILHTEHSADEHDGQGTGVGNQGGEADQHGEQHAIGNLQHGEHHQLSGAEDQSQHHLSCEVAAEGAIQRRAHQATPAGRQPLEQPRGDRITAQQQKHRQHQDDQPIDRGAHRGPEDAEQPLAELRRQSTDLGDQITAEISELRWQTMVQSPGLPLVDPGFRCSEQSGRGIGQLTELVNKQRQQLHRRQPEQAHGEQHHQGDGTDAGETAAHQPATGQVQQKGDQGRREEQAGKRRELHQ